MTATDGVPQVTSGELFKVCDGMYYVYSTPEGASNAGIAYGPEATIVIDSRLTPALGSELAAAVSNGYREADASLMVVNTHFHGDHWFGNSAFHNAVIIASEWTKQALRREWRSQVARFSSLRPEQAEAFAAVEPRLPHVGITDHLVIELGGQEVVIETVQPAHTPGDLVVWGDSGRAAFVGDLVFNEAWPVLWDADVDGWLKTLEALADRAPEVVVPGHGPCGGVELIERMGAALELLVMLARRRESLWSSLVERSPFAGWSRAERIAPSVERIRERAN